MRTLNHVRQSGRSGSGVTLVKSELVRGVRCLTTDKNPTVAGCRKQCRLLYEKTVNDFHFNNNNKINNLMF